MPLSFVFWNNSLWLGNLWWHSIRFGLYQLIKKWLIDDLVCLYLEIHRQVWKHKNSFVRNLNKTWNTIKDYSTKRFKLMQPKIIGIISDLISDSWYSLSVDMHGCVYINALHYYALYLSGKTCLKRFCLIWVMPLTFNLMRIKARKDPSDIGF